MENPFIYSDDNKRYHTLSYHNRHTRSCRVYKAAVDAGFSCPNIDGTKSLGGCSYCSGGSGYFTALPAVPIEEQLRRELARIGKKDPGAQAVAYFQVHSNTYAPVSVLRKKYEEALSVPGICGLAIATRADCLPAPVLDLLEELAHKTEITVELGLQTASDTIAAAINRGHTWEEFLAGYQSLRSRGIRVSVHLIDGLPGESFCDMLETARLVGLLRPDGVKIHLLHFIKSTRLGNDYEAGRCRAMEKDEYIQTVVHQLELLAPETVIERLTGDGQADTLLAPRWSRDKLSVLAGIDTAQAALDSWQGKRYCPDGLCGDSLLCPGTERAERTE